MSRRSAAAGWLLPMVLAVAAGAGGCASKSGAGEPDPGVVVEIPPGDPGNPDGHCAIPTQAWLEDSSTPTTVVGTGTPESCTGDQFIAAVAKGGVVTFDCGPAPATIRLTRPAKIFNATGPKIVIDGGGKITLSGEGVTRILYMNTCDRAQGWTTDHCQDQDAPQLTVQNLTFANGDARNEPATRAGVGDLLDGGGAIWARGGRLKVVSSRFMNNVCTAAGQEVGGGAIRAFSQYHGLPVYVVNSTFGAEGMGNSCSNGGALSSIGVSWTVLNTLISDNRATGTGGNPGNGGCGGGIYNDGNTMTLSLCGTRMERNDARAFGRAIFFVSNDKTGDVVIDRSVITGNTGSHTWEPTYPQISNHAETPITVTDSVIHD